MRPVEIDLTLRSRRHLKHCIMNATQITTAIIEITMTTITRVFDESGTCSVVISTEIEKKKQIKIQSLIFVTGKTICSNDSILYILGKVCLR